MNTCPTIEQLRLWLAGKLDESQTAEIEAHIESCAAVCQPLLDRMPGFGGLRTTRVAPKLSGGPIEGGKVDGGMKPPIGEVRPDFLAGYRIEGDSPLGRGGMGVVWKATQLPMNRPVALKVMTAAILGSERARLRFEREVELTANLVHPHIARIYDSGVEQGVCYYAMELIDGQNLDDYVTAGKVAQPQIIELMKVVCRAVQYAHQRGIIHRDLKPSNILTDKEGQPHVLDFGLAKAMESDQHLSIDGEVAGTPVYMSPEQAGGKPDMLDTRSDVYTLGVILFHLLCGQFPHETSGSALQVMRRIIDNDPRQLKEILPRADRDLNVLLGKALAKEPDRRYGTAGDLADDLDRYLQHEPINAQPPTVTYLLRKKVAKYRGTVAIAGVVSALLLTVAILSYIGITTERNSAILANIEKARQVEETEKQRVRAVKGEVLANSNSERAEASAKRAAEREIDARASERSAELRLADGLVSQGDALAIANRWVEARESYLNSYDITSKLGASSFKSVVALCDARASSPPPLRSFVCDNRWSTYVAFGPDGRSIFSLDIDGNAIVRDLPTGRPLFTIGGRNSAQGGRGALSPDGHWAAITGDSPGVLRLWDMNERKEVRTWVGHGRAVWSLAFSPDNYSFASGCQDGTIKLWDVNSATEVKTLNGHTNVVSTGDTKMIVKSLAFSADGFQLLSSGPDQFLKLWDIKLGTEISSARGGFFDSGAFTSDGHRVLSSEFDYKNTVTLRDGQSLTRLHDFVGHTNQVISVKFSPDDRWALSGSADRTIRLWDVQAGTCLCTFGGHTGGVTSVAFDPNGRFIASAGTDNTVRLWDIQSQHDCRVIAASTAPIHSVSFSPDGRYALSGSHDGRVRLWDLATGKELRSMTAHTSYVTTVAISIDGHHAVSGSWDKTLRYWDLQSGKELWHADDLTACAVFTPDGKSVIGATTKAIKQWNLASGKETRTLVTRLGAQSLAISKDGRRLLSNTPFPAVWDLDSSGAPRAFTDSNNPNLRGAISPDGKRALTGATDGTMKYWNLDSGSEIRTLGGGHTGTVNQVDISPDGQWGISGSADTMVKLWDLTTGKEVRAFASPNHGVWSVAFRPDGNGILSGNIDGTVRYWDFSRAKQYADFEAKLQSLDAAGSSAAATSDSDALLGNWYAFRGVNDWAIEMLEKARAGRATVDPLTLARCYWEMSGEILAKSSLTRAACLTAARREYAAALAAAKDPQDTFYLELCLSAVEREAAGGDSTRTGTAGPNGATTRPTQNTVVYPAYPPEVPRKKPATRPATRPNVLDVAALETSIAALEKLVKESPQDEENRIKLALRCSDLGIARRNAGQFEEGLKVEHRALELREKLASDKPSDLDRQSWLGASYNNYGIILEAMGKPDEALRSYETALKHQRIAFDAAPTVAQYRGFLRNHYANIASAQVRLKRPAEASAAALKCLELLPQNPAITFYAGVTLARCAGLAADKAGASPEDLATRQKYVDLASKTLRQAADAGYAPRDRLDHDTAFDAIRNEPEFQKLLHRSKDK